MEDENNNSFRDYQFEDKIHHKNSLKKKVAQAKRLLSNQASKEYSQVHEQSDKKSVPKMLVSVSKINGLKGKLKFLLAFLVSPGITLVTPHQYSRCRGE